MLARFKVDPKGQLSAEGEASKAALSERSGFSFGLLPTAPDLLCWVRVPPAGGKSPQPGVVLAGDAAGFPLSDLLAFVSQARWTGMVRVHAPAGERTLSLKDGEVRGATSDEPADRLGEVMVRLGYARQEQVDEVLQEQPPSKVGRALVERGVLQAHDLWKCLTHQVSEIFHAVVLCREGAFTLWDQELEDRQGHNVELSTQSLLMDSIRKIDEMAHFRKRIPHGRMYVGRKRPSDGKLENEEDRILGQLSGEQTVLELGQANKLSEFDATKIVFRLLEGGYAQVGDKPLPAPSQSPPLAAGAPASPERPRAKGPDAREVISVFNRVFREIRDEVAKQNMDQEFVAAANAAIAGEGVSSSPVLVGLSFDSDGTLPEQRLRQQFDRCKGQLGSAPAASLRKALSELMFFLLFQAGELLESRADEDLARRVKDLIASLGP